jgi:hypothetical protein
MSTPAYPVSDWVHTTSGFDACTYTSAQPPHAPRDPFPAVLVDLNWWCNASSCWQSRHCLPTNALSSVHVTQQPQQQQHQQAHRPPAIHRPLLHRTRHVLCKLQVPCTAPRRTALHSATSQTAQCLPRPAAGCRLQYAVHTLKPHASPPLRWEAKNCSQQTTRGTVAVVDVCHTSRQSKQSPTCTAHLVEPEAHTLLHPTQHDVPMQDDVRNRPAKMLKVCFKSSCCAKMHSGKCWQASSDPACIPAAALHKLHASVPERPGHMSSIHCRDAIT